MSDLDLVIKNGTVVTAGDTVKCDVGVKDGRVVLLGAALGDAQETIDAAGLLVLPGGIDSHVHIDERPFYGVLSADDFESGSISAACGGTTTIIPFAEQIKGEPLRAAVDAYHQRAAGKSIIDYAFHLMITAVDEQILGQELPALVEDGYTSVKVYMTYDGMVLNDREILDTLAVARETGALVMIHAENDHCIRWLTEKLDRGRQDRDSATSPTWRRPRWNAKRPIAPLLSVRWSTSRCSSCTFLLATRPSRFSGRSSAG